MLEPENNAPLFAPECSFGFTGSQMQHNNLLGHHCSFELRLAISTVFWHQIHNLDVYTGHIVDNNRYYWGPSSLDLGIKELETLEKRGYAANSH